MPVEAILGECFANFALLPRARAIDDTRMRGVITDVPINFFSGVAMTRDVDVARVIAQFEGRPFRWWISPSTRPKNLASILMDHGMRHNYDAPGMVADLESVPLRVPLPDGVEVRRVTALDDWADVFERGFKRPEGEGRLWKEAYAQLPEWMHFVGYLEGTPVATTSVLLRGILAGVYHVVTLPEARGRGIGSAITREAMRHAHEHGARTAVLQASEMGFSVYRSLGFVQTCDLSQYVL